MALRRDRGGLASFGLNRPALVVAAFTIAALAMGGGGTSEPRSEMLLELVAAGAFAAWMLARDPRADGPVPRSVLMLCAVVLALPVLQLVPLPPAVWQALPGHEQEVAALALVGKADAWRPWTIAPSRTLAALLAVAPPLLAFAMTSTLARRERLLVIAAITGMAGAAMLLGALQVASGLNGGWRLYGDYNIGFINGFHANRNAAADALLVGLAGVPVVASSLRNRIGTATERWLVLAACAALGIATAVTASRTGIILIPVTLALALVTWSPGLVGRSQAFGALTVAILLAVGALFAAQANAPLGRILRRFTLEGEFRGELWTDTLPAISQYWPLGSGMSTFRAAFLPHERLVVVDQTWPVRAHNDYLELLLEGGIPGLVLLGAAILLLGSLIVRALRTGNTRERPQVMFAIATMVIIGLHSIVDYPLRSMALAHVMAVAVGILAAVSGAGMRRNTEELADA